MTRHQLRYRVAGGKTPSRGKTPTHDLRATGRNPVKCLLTISVGEWPEFVLHLEQLGRVDVAVGRQPRYFML